MFAFQWSMAGIFVLIILVMRCARPKCSTLHFKIKFTTNWNKLLHDLQFMIRTILQRIKLVFIVYWIRDPYGCTLWMSILVKTAFILFRYSRHVRRISFLGHDLSNMNKFAVISATSKQKVALTKLSFFGQQTRNVFQSLKKDWMKPLPNWKHRWFQTILRSLHRPFLQWPVLLKAAPI